jgi:hypothetical protein
MGSASHVLRATFGPVEVLLQTFAQETFAQAMLLLAPHHQKLRRAQPDTSSEVMVHVQLVTMISIGQVLEFQRTLVQIVYAHYMLQPVEVRQKPPRVNPVTGCTTRMELACFALKITF